MKHRLAAIILRVANFVLEYWLTTNFVLKGLCEIML